jgi:predicted transcriptional regulator
MVEETVRTHIVLPKELINAVDRLVGRRKRSTFFAQAVAEKLERERLGRALAATAGFLERDAHPEWQTPEDVSAWVRDLRLHDNVAGQRELSRHG